MIDKILKDIKGLFKVQDKAKFVKQNIPYLAFFYIGNIFSYHDTLGGRQSFTIINESGLYSLILSSKLPQAKDFKRWVTTEVLPSIRKNGGYIKNQKK